MELADLSDDHVELHAVIGRAERALPAFARDPATGAAEFGAVMTEMADLLDEHIAEEEREVFPVIREHVSAPDFARCEAAVPEGDVDRPADVPAALGGRPVHPRGARRAAGDGRPAAGAAAAADRGPLPAAVATSSAADPRPPRRGPGVLVRRGP